MRWPARSRGLAVAMTIKIRTTGMIWAFSASKVTLACQELACAPGMPSSDLMSRWTEGMGLDPVPIR